MLVILVRTYSKVIMKKISLTFIVFFLIIGFACDKKSSLEDGKDFALDYEFTVSLNDDEFQIHFDELLEDSRCPVLAFCQWEGRARVQIVTVSNDVEKVYEFSTLAPTHMDTIFENGNDRYQFELLQIDPFPTGGFQAPEAYSIAFNLKKL